MVIVYFTAGTLMLAMRNHFKKAELIIIGQQKLCRRERPAARPGAVVTTPLRHCYRTTPANRRRSVSTAAAPSL